MPLTDEQLLMKHATMIVCPWCDLKKCIGRFDCPDVEKKIEYLREKYCKEDSNGSN